MGRPRAREWAACQRAGGELREQVRVGKTRWHGQTYAVFKCDCGGKVHKNKVYELSATKVWRMPESRSASNALSGRSIFGQVLRKGVGA